MRFLLPRRPLLRRALVVLIAVVAAIFVCVSLASAGTAPHRQGSGWWTCTHDAHADVANDMEVRDNFSTGNPLCIRSSSWGDTFSVFKSSVHQAWGAYPNVFQGCEMDGTDLPQVCTHGHEKPVRVASIRSDVSTASWYIPQRGTRTNVAYDIWFDKTSRAPKGWDDGAEVMVWDEAWGIGRPAYSRVVTIDGIRWGYATWRTSRGSVSWNYVRYWRLSGGQRRQAVTLNLLDFFKDAERQGRLSPSWWLTGTEFGAELCGGGNGLSVHSFTDRLVTG